MTIEQAKEEYGHNADTMCQILCGLCDATDWYCSSDCKSIEWVRKHYDKAIAKIAELDGEYWTFLNRARTWK